MSLPNHPILLFPFLLLSTIFPMVSTGQHPEADTVLHANHTVYGMKGANRLTLGLGHTHVSEGKVEGKTEWIVMPSWSLNYDYWVSNKWAVGLQTDLVLETFLIENHEEELIERAHPLTVVPVALFKPGKNFSLLGGVGIEFAKGHNLATTRLGLEYGFHLPENWEVGAAMVWDNKWNYYNSWGLAFTVSKIWPKAWVH
jgi:hypothetical protein